MPSMGPTSSIGKVAGSGRRAVGAGGGASADTAVVPSVPSGAELTADELCRSVCARHLRRYGTWVATRVLGALLTLADQAPSARDASEHRPSAPLSRGSFLSTGAAGGRMEAPVTRVLNNGCGLSSGKTSAERHRWGAAGSSVLYTRRRSNHPLLEEVVGCQGDDRLVHNRRIGTLSSRAGVGRPNALGEVADTGPSRQHIFKGNCSPSENTYFLISFE